MVKIMVKQGRKIKLSQNLRPFVSRVVRDGKVQRAFKKMVAPVNACVASGVKKGMSGAAIRKVVRDCGKKIKGSKLPF